MKNKQWKRTGWVAGLMFGLCLSSCTNEGRKTYALDAQPVVGSVEW
ncbi:hypothetical protein [Bacteroides stercorirosoris]|nr:hypothetical protein [Bacteroides stercorirosoris]